MFCDDDRNNNKFFVGLGFEVFRSQKMFLNFYDVLGSIKVYFVYNYSMCLSFTA